MLLVAQPIMADLGLSDDERMIQRTARDFAFQKLRRKARAHEAQGVSAALVQEFRALGLDAIDRPPDLGGGLGPFAQALALEELGAVDAGAALALDATAPARYAVLRLGGPDDRKAILESQRVALAVDLAGELVRDERRLSGTVSWCPTREPSRVVAMRPDGVWLFEAGAFHASPLRPLALAAAGGSSLRLEMAEPIARWEGDLSMPLAEVRLYQAALLVGLARAAPAYAGRYLQQRATAGLAPAVVLFLVEMARAADAARLATWRAACAIATASGAAWASAAALAAASEAALANTDRSVQLLGPQGLLERHPLEKWMREARALTLAWGGPPALAETLAANLA